ncbi:Signal transduction histidine kinase [Hespellia stercorisuis DSM 15480]|uniref:histidine kinase n=2 Tax=Hespellia stercorisuis TaxID=180311 RepID=A0A1M6UIU5_9FIRM|nr:Signal transduction histidine kinase [Hespellia stercorisuis DSM 15480]
MKIMISCLCIVIVFLWLRMRKMKKDIYEFTEKLDRSLEDMAAGKEIEKEAIPSETLWGKTNEKLRRIGGIWKKNSEKKQKEKEQIKEWISDISHQTKTPIANLKMYVELLQDETEEEKRREFLSNISKQTNKLDFFIQSMVKMSRLETGVIEIRQENHDLYRTIGQAVSAIVPKAEQKKIRIYADCEEEYCVKHDAKWTEEALENVLDNAVKYTGRQGRICVSVTRQEIYTRISIRDNGKGIAPERQAEIFRRFYREPEVHDQEGIGVGLYLAREIIALQNGYMEVCSAPGAGAEFQIYLPNS